LHAEHVAEEERGELAGVGGGSGDDHHAEGEHADEQQPDARVFGEAGAPADEVDAEHHHERAGQGTDGDIEPPQERQRDARDHAVGERVADEGDAAQHHPRPDERRGHDGEHAREQRALHEGELERLDEPIHATTVAFEP
jgi:hypothetical protein